MPKSHYPQFTEDLLSAAAGMLLTASFPDIDMAWLAWFALVPLMAALRGASARTAFRRGMVAGMVHYLTLVYWLVHTMHTYGGLPWTLAVPPLFFLAAYLSLYIGFFAWLWVRIPMGAAAIVMAPAAWTGLEYLRSFFLSGFPWELLGYSQYRNLHLIQISDILGVYGVSYLIVMGNVAVFQMGVCLVRARQGRSVDVLRAAVGLATFMAAAGCIWIYGAFRIQFMERIMAASPSLRAAVVQGNIDQMVKWDPAFQEKTVEKYLALSRKIAPPPDLVVWPETAVPFYLFGDPANDAALTDRVMRGVRDTGAWFVIGSPAFERTDTGIGYYNRAYLVSPGGMSKGGYDKVHLVPFGEYVPFQKWLPFIQKMVAQIGDFKTGRKGKTLLMEEGESVRIGVLICYEIIFSDLARAAAKNGANLLVNITNDGWYGYSSAPYQHFSMAVFRAVENKRSLIRAANTGISGFVDPIGRISGTTPLFVDAVMSKTVPLSARKTLYTRWGDWFSSGCVGLVFMFTGLKMLRRKTP